MYVVLVQLCCDVCRLCCAGDEYVQVVCDVMD